MSTRIQNRFGEADPYSITVKLIRDELEKFDDIETAKVSVMSKWTTEYKIKMEAVARDTCEALRQMGHKPEIN